MVYICAVIGKSASLSTWVQGYIAWQLSHLYHTWLHIRYRLDVTKPTFEKVTFENDYSTCLMVCGVWGVWHSWGLKKWRRTNGDHSLHVKTWLSHQVGTCCDPVSVNGEAMPKGWRVKELSSISACKKSLWRKQSFFTGTCEKGPYLVRTHAEWKFTEMDCTRLKLGSISKQWQ